jgi:hypothetical protein
MKILVFRFLFCFCIILIDYIIVVFVGNKCMSLVSRYSIVIIIVNMVMIDSCLVSFRFISLTINDSIDCLSRSMSSIRRYSFSRKSCSTFKYSYDQLLQWQRFSSTKHDILARKEHIVHVKFRPSNITSCDCRHLSQGKSHRYKYRRMAKIHRINLFDEQSIVVTNLI